LRKNRSQAAATAAALFACNVLDEDRRDETRSLTRNKIFGTRWIGQGLKALLPPAAAAVPAIIKT
jgi:hypothetical protein